MSFFAITSTFADTNRTLSSKQINTQCPTLTATNGPNSCTSDLTFFQEATGGQGSVAIEAGASFSVDEKDAIDLTTICDISDLVTSFSRFLSVRVKTSNDSGIAQATEQITAISSLGPVCRATYELWPGMRGCKTEQVWEHGPGFDEDDSVDGGHDGI